MASPHAAQALQRNFQGAIDRYGQGRFDEAGALCRKVLKSIPKDPGVLHLMGAIHLQTGRNRDAITVLGRAAGIDRGNAEIHNNLATAYRREGRAAEAVASGERAIAVNPSFAAAHFGLGRAHEDLGDAARAAHCYETAIVAAPDHIEARRHLANVLLKLGRHDDGLSHCDTLLASFPTDADAHNTRGAMLVALDRRDEALDAFETALGLDERLADGHVNLGNLLCDHNEPGRAVGHFERSLELDPDCPDALANLGHALRQLGRIDDATAAYDRSIALAPTGIEANFGNSVAHLTEARYGAGWRYYLHRDSMAGAEAGLHRDFLPGDLAGKTILVEMDQGIGDEIFFLRFAAALRQRGAKVLYTPDPRLVAMIERSGAVDAVVEPGDNGAGRDYRLSVGDLPYLLGMSDDDVPPPSLRIPPLAERRAALADRLNTLGPAPHIGLTWRAGTRNRFRRLYKEAPTAGLVDALRGVAGTIVALQRNPDPGEMAKIESSLGRPLADLTAVNDDLEDMLALAGLLDDYVCVSNTNLHLRATQGAASRVLAPNPPEFRWMARGPESPWFPGTTVYRQDFGGNWADALDRLGDDLIGRHGPI
jgi:tetratricopeptide (TPR) repeat protein